MKVIVALICIQFLAVFFADISRFPDTLKSVLKWVITKGKFSDPNYVLKPWDCALCLTFWGSVCFLLCTSQFTLVNIAVACMLAAFTGLTKNAIILVEDLVTKVNQLIYKYIIDNED